MIDVSNDVLDCGLLVLAVRDEVAGVEVDHDDSPRLLDPLEDPVRHCTYCTQCTHCTYLSGMFLW